MSQLDAVAELFLEAARVPAAAERPTINEDPRTLVEHTEEEVSWAGLVVVAVPGWPS